jgi:hypothetical protein
MLPQYLGFLRSKQIFSICQENISFKKQNYVFICVFTNDLWSVYTDWTQLRADGTPLSYLQKADSHCSMPTECHGLTWLISVAQGKWQHIKKRWRTTAKFHVLCNSVFTDYLQTLNECGVFKQVKNISCTSLDTAKTRNTKIGKM